MWSGKGVIFYIHSLRVTQRKAFSDPSNPPPFHFCSTCAWPTLTDSLPSSICRPRYIWHLWMSSLTWRSTLNKLMPQDLADALHLVISCDLEMYDLVITILRVMVQFWNLRNTRSTTSLGSLRLRCWRCMMHKSAALVVWLRTSCMKSEMASTLC